MFLGMEWYWWLMIVGISIPFKIQFIKWWNNRQEEQKNSQKDQWGNEE